MFDMRRTVWSCAAVLALGLAHGIMAAADTGAGEVEALLAAIEAADGQIDDVGAKVDQVRDGIVSDTRTIEQLGRMLDVGSNPKTVALRLDDVEDSLAGHENDLATQGASASRLRQSLERIVARARQLGEPKLVAFAGKVIGKVESTQEDVDRAKSTLLAALEAAEALRRRIDKLGKS